MTANGKRSVRVGQTAKYQWKEVEIVAVSPNGRLVKVSGNPHWIEADSLTFDDSLSTSPNTSPKPELYPKGDVLTNEVSGALKTDFQPSADTVPLSLPLHTWEVGQRARLLGDMPHDFQPLKEGDEGVVVKLGTGLGFKPDGLRAAVSYRSLNGKTVFVLDHCEFVVDGSPAQPEATTTDTPETERDSALELELKMLQGENKRLSEIIDSQRLDLTLLQRALDAAKTDDNTTLIEDNGKLKAALMDAEKRNQRLEADKARLEQTNKQQSEMLRGAAMPQSVARPEPTAHLKTIMTHGGSNGFANAEIPHGYQIVAVTTEVYDGKLTRLIHLLVCGDSPTPHETLAEKVTVGFEQVTIRGLDETPLPLDTEKVQNEFDIALKSGASPEEIIRIGNERVVEKAWNAAQAYRTSHPTSPSSNKLLIGEGYG